MVAKLQKYKQQKETVEDIEEAFQFFYKESHIM